MSIFSRKKKTSKDSNGPDKTAGIPVHDSHPAKEISGLSGAIPIALSGGTFLPKGSYEKFRDTLASTPLPVKISEIILAEKPLSSTARGALMMAIAE